MTSISLLLLSERRGRSLDFFSYGGGVPECHGMKLVSNILQGQDTAMHNRRALGSILEQICQQSGGRTYNLDLNAVGRKKG